MKKVEKLVINGNKKLFGEVLVSGAKNASLPLMAISLLFQKGFELNNVPHLMDTKIMLKLLNDLGIKSDCSKQKIKFYGKPIKFEANDALVKKMRASILILAPLLQSKKKAVVPLPGGCAIGSRPIDLHIEVVKKLGARIEFKDGYLKASLSKEGFLGDVEITFPFVSVGATECAIMASVLARGTTILNNVAKEPEIIDLGNCLIKAGADIQGLGKSKIVVKGVKELNPISYSVISDRIEAGSFVIAAAITKGEIVIKNVKSMFLHQFLEKIKKTGADVESFKNEIKITGSQRIKNVDISTEPYPGFPTDLQAQFMSLMCFSSGESIIRENIFENRFRHVPELKKMGARIKIFGNKAIVNGIDELFPAKLEATDLRASMSLILACLATKGESEIFDLEHLRRGYENIENKLTNLGADLN